MVRRDPRTAWLLAAFAVLLLLLATTDQLIGHSSVMVMVGAWVGVMVLLAAATRPRPPEAQPAPRRATRA